MDATVSFFGYRMRLQVFFLLVGLGVLQFGRQFSRVAARIEMVGVLAGFLLATALTCERKVSKTNVRKSRVDIENMMLFL